MRLIPVVCAAVAAVTLVACTYVERERTPPAVVQTQPATVVTPVPVAPPPTTVTVRPAY